MGIHNHSILVISVAKMIKIVSTFLTSAVLAAVSSPAITVINSWEANDDAPAGAQYNFTVSDATIGDGTCTLTIGDAFLWFHTWDMAVSNQKSGTDNVFGLVIANPAYQPDANGTFVDVHFELRFDGAVDAMTASLSLSCDTDDIWETATNSFGQGYLNSHAEVDLRALTDNDSDGNYERDQISSFNEVVITFPEAIANFYAHDGRISVSNTTDTVFTMTSMPGSLAQFNFGFDYADGSTGF